MEIFIKDGDNVYHMAYLEQINTMAENKVKHEIKENSQEFVDLVNQFKRYRDINDRRVFQLQQELQKATQQLAKIHGKFEKITDIENVKKARERLLQYQKGDRNKPLETPIDRTGVAPKDVQIEKIFNCAPGGNVSNSRFK